MMNVNAGEAMNILSITRPTLDKYIKDGMIHVDTSKHKKELYLEDILTIKNKGIARKVVIYSSVSNNSDKGKLLNELKCIKITCVQQDIDADLVYYDILSEGRKDFFDMITGILNNQIKQVIISRLDVFQEKELPLLKHILQIMHCDLLVL